MKRLLFDQIQLNQYNFSNTDKILDTVSIYIDIFKIFFITRGAKTNLKERKKKKSLVCAANFTATELCNRLGPSNKLLTSFTFWFSCISLLCSFQVQAANTPAEQVFSLIYQFIENIYIHITFLKFNFDAKILCPSPVSVASTSLLYFPLIR